VHVEQRRLETLENLEAERIAQALQVDKERQKSERLRLRREALAEELKSLNSMATTMHAEHSLQIEALEIEHARWTRDLKQLNLEIRDTQALIKGEQDTGMTTQ
jgi:hypothetical protein